VVVLPLLLPLLLPIPLLLSTGSATESQPTSAACRLSGVFAAGLPKAEGR
jgi:hypothetical protein